jgi:hypothetical protein
MACGLHFNIYSWESDWPEGHGPATCPECGTKGQILIFACIEMQGEIFEYVPGMGGTLIFERDRNEER